MRKQHDVGGQRGDMDGENVDISEHAEQPWELMSLAIFNVVRKNGYLNLHQMRRVVEDLPEDLYNTSYFERRVEGMRKLFEDNDILTGAEIDERMAQIRKRREEEKV